MAVVKERNIRGRCEIYEILGGGALSTDEVEAMTLFVITSECFIREEETNLS